MIRFLSVHNTDPVSAFSNLADAVRGVGLVPRWVLARSDKIPVDCGWPDIYPSDDDAREHLQQGGVIGVEPWSLKSAVGDVDYDSDIADFAISEGFILPWADTPTSRLNGRHLYARTEIPEPNGKWRCGDIRGARGYALIHDAHHLAEQVSDNFSDAPIQGFEQLRMFDLSGQPGNAHTESGHRGESKVRLVISETSRSRTWRGAAMYLGTVGIGQRHDWLYRRLVCAPKDADLSELAQLVNTSRLEQPLPPTDLTKTVRSAERSRRKMTAKRQLNRLQIERGKVGGRRSGEARWMAAVARNEAIRLTKSAHPEMRQRELAEAFDCSERTVRAALSR